ncbi:hypothetical protein AK812_SmicGene18705 [Symbiodinium microadriaticum]|uniref:Uncharacterized protein n=1 Tax=Symbiodinium microadriaticum TaxID=2951 RepID=A0A1Q9DUG7_SYMMI|nr:hypothetical protein AK812_SmicGene18705 [Symbiodinium microadriaticum]CAE7280450.1 unnamed protein product [Symbiodinium sp. KB8]CAE7852852.1 unnamed protein product [Symbiodinium microadriaticum]
MLHLDGSQPEHGARLPADTFSGQSGNCISAAVMRLDTLAQDSDREAQVETLVEASNKFAKRCRWTHIDARHNMEDHGGVSAAGHQGRISAVAGWLSKAEGALHIMRISCDTRAQRPELQNSEWYLELQRYADSWWTAFLGESRIACRAATSAGAFATEPASSGRLSLSRVCHIFQYPFAVANKQREREGEMEKVYLNEMLPAASRDAMMSIIHTQLQLGGVALTLLALFWPRWQELHQALGGLLSFLKCSNRCPQIPTLMLSTLHITHSMLYQLLTNIPQQLRDRLVVIQQTSQMLIIGPFYTEIVGLSQGLPHKEISP